ncbi:sterol desaturase family protein [Ruegeria pomeroyi]|uniref:Sterol desaturase-like protein n=2 Tax=Ruegeria pomeroyi TaxID=89184 RepID=Q5LW18_RUEPO|nr:sterol desaturase family protein [Ruegeria pomeroyi]HCE69751.1 sterol desaturase family protein [Ruegeria sp.]AAV93842.1 sterol desaturase-like protein [Ruegeria pomeroyi DSS-3]NVK95394.1 sterol desaturase family protein [Ruegeria pomeroyi]NVL02085.1 sterol desaturase family protein [Ruegeria pomeroyi]QWV07432.1 sterol desaturase family protein [Ruegeria pomeroyi]
MENESLVRLAMFVGLFVLFAIAERLAPRRMVHPRRPRRWLTNLTISVLNTVTLRALAVGLPLLAVGAALDASALGWGLFNHLGWPGWVEVLLAVLILDFAIWGQHLITHKIPLLWRLHRVHHADTDIDVTTAIRFHPVEIALSMLLKIGLVYLLGPSALAVILFEILLNGTALFNHSNLRLPLALDAVLRKVLVTPDMHRVHHSVLREEHDSNYGFALSIWDRMMGTYVAQPAKGHDEMTIGLAWQDDRPTRLGWSLLLPFRRR